MAPLCLRIGKVNHRGGKGSMEQRCPSHGSQEADSQRKESDTRCRHQGHAPNVPSPP